MKSARPPLFSIFLLGLGFFGVSVIWGIYNAFVPVFLEKRFGVEPGLIGFFLTLDNIAALLIQPPIGAWSDRLQTRIGRRMPFILVGAPLGALAFGLIPLAAALPLFVACTSTLLLAMALYRTPVVALMPDLVPSQYRSQANGIINLMGGVGAIFAYLGGAALYESNPNFPFWMGSILVIAATVLLLLFVREPKISTEKIESVPPLLDSLREVWSEREKSAPNFFLALFFWMLGYSALESFWTLYSVNHLGITEANGTRLLGQLSLVFVIFALPVGFMTAKIGRKRALQIGLFLMSALLLVAFALPIPILKTPLFSLPVLGVVPILGALLMFMGIAWALVTIPALPMIVEMTSVAKIGTFTGLYYLFSTLASIVGPNLNGLMVQFSGKNYNAILLSSAICMGIAIWFLRGVQRGEMQRGEVQPETSKQSEI